MTVDAHNNVTTDFQSIQTAGGGVAIATGIGINTIDTGTVAQVMKSTIEAKTAAINAREELDVDQTMVGATVGGMGLNANVTLFACGLMLFAVFNACSCCPSTGRPTRWAYPS